MKKELNTSPKMNIFKKLGNLFVFQSKPELKVETPVDPVTQKINQLIEMNLLPMVAEVEKNGYILSPIQKMIFYKKLELKLNKRETDEIKTLFKMGYEVEHQFLHHYLINGEEPKSLIYVINEYAPLLWENKNFCENIFNAFYEDYNKYYILLTTNGLKQGRKYSLGVDSYYHQKLEDTYYGKIRFFNDEILGLIHHDISLDMYFSFVNLVKTTKKFSENLIRNFVIHGVKKSKGETIDDTSEAYYYTVFGDRQRRAVETLEKSIKFYFSQDKEKTVNQLIEKLPELYLKNLINKENNEGKNIETQSLPKNIQDQLNILSEKIKMCHQEKKEFSKVEWEQIEKLWTNHLGKAIDTYNKMPEHYMKTAQSIESKTADALLLETISNLDEIIESKLLQINENRMTDLSAIQRQTKALKQII